MNPKGEEKTTFVTRKRVFGYKVMLFGLDNAGATYQRLVTKLFDGLIGKVVKAYIDYTVVKSTSFSSHLAHLQLVFERSRQHRVKSNPSKCKFRGASGVFLGHVISKKAIEDHPKLVKAIKEVPEPISRKDVQVLSGRVAALSRFVSRMTDRCFPFFKIL